MANHREKVTRFEKNMDNSLSPCLRLLFFLLGASICTLFTLLVPFSPFYGTDHGNHGHSDTNLGLITGLLKDKFPCGRDTPTALSRGCKFESYTATWQPPQCFDSALDAEFRQTRPWKFFTSRNSTTELSWSDVEKIKPGQAWTTWEFHLYSCAFLWKKEVKIAHGLVSGTIDYHQCLDHALMHDYARPKDHVSIPYWPRFTSCRPPSDISVHQFDLKPGVEKGLGIDGQLAEVHGHSHIHGANKEFDHKPRE